MVEVENNLSFEASDSKWHCKLFMKHLRQLDYVNTMISTTDFVLCKEVKFRVSSDQWPQRNLWRGKCPALSLMYDRLFRKAESESNSHVHHYKTHLY